jgi:hypothetical protein
MDIYEKARKAIKETFTGKWESVYEVFNTFLEGDVKHFARVPSSFVRWEDVFLPVAKVTVFAMSMMPVAVNSSVYTPLIGDIAFYDVAEALMAAYVFGRFDVRYMPRARILMQRTGKRVDVAPLEKLLEELGVMRGGVLTGVGQALAKALIYGATVRGPVAEGFYLSMLVAHTLLAELRPLRHESVRTLLLEAIARYKTIGATVREWMKTAPKLYLRELALFYGWEDAVKDAALMLIDKKEDFRFTL